MREKDLVYKDPDARLDYYFDWSEWLGDDTILSAVVTGTNVEVDTEHVQEKGVVVWLTGGVLGQNGSCLCSIKTAQGRDDDRTMKMFFKHK